MTDSNRIEWLLHQMAESNVDALVAFSSAWHTVGNTNAVQVLTGFKNMGNGAVVLDKAGSRTLIVSPAWDGERATERAEGVRVVATNDLAQVVAEEQNGKRGAVRQIGVAGLDALPQRIAGPIRQAWANRMQPMDDVIVRAGRCKTPAEIARAREIAAMAEQVFDRLLEFARPGMHEFELASELYRYSKALGADDNFLLMSSSQFHHGPRPPNRRVLEKGDLILGEISPGADGQFVQICRTAVLGPISDVQQKNYDILWRSMEAGLAAAKPGRAVAEVATAMNDVVAEAGYGDYNGPPYFRVRGHGLGSISSLPGDVGTDNQTVLEEGMMFVIHPNQFLPGSGYMMCGEPVVITSAGAEPLSTRYSKLISIPV
jgi:Xaa-Pro aminopeptidase